MFTLVLIMTTVTVFAQTQSKVSVTDSTQGKTATTRSGKLDVGKGNTTVPMVAAKQAPVAQQQETSSTKVQTKTMSNGKVSHASTKTKVHTKSQVHDKKKVVPAKRKGSKSTK
ncbi:MAG: hypothetical protein SFW35_01025 [Chitinophagales bacterium]|nr:hypothetical protein [Chitinophagales bacterium]